jgi:AhpC/TSA family
MVTILIDNRELEEPHAAGGGDALWLPAERMQPVTGWQPRPEGLCRGDTCVPVPAGREASFVSGGRVNAAAFWRHLGHPALHDDAGSVWVLGQSAGARRERLASLEAPDFELPDLEGRPHRLSDYRGRKVLLATWASW